MAKRSHGSLKEKVLQLISETGALSVKEVQSKLKTKLAYTTVMTVMSRMHEEGLLKREKIGSSYVYELKKSKKQTTKYLLNRWLGAYQKKPLLEMVNTFLSTSDTIDAEELQAIEALIKEYRKEIK